MGLCAVSMQFQLILYRHIRPMMATMQCIGRGCKRRYDLPFHLTLSPTRRTNLVGRLFSVIVFIIILHRATRGVTKRVTTTYVVNGEGTAIAAFFRSVDVCRMLR